MDARGRLAPGDASLVDHASRAGARAQRTRGPSRRAHRRRRQRCALRRDRGQRGRGPRARPRVRAARFPRREQPAHAQPPLRARARGRPHDRPVRRGGVLGRSLARHQGQDGRSPRTPCHPPVRRSGRVDDEPRRAVPAAARRHAPSRPHERVLPRRRQGAGQRLLSRGREHGRRGPLRRGSHGGDDSRWPVRRGDRRAARRDAGDSRQGLRRGIGRIRGKHPLAERKLGRGGGQLHRPRHPVQQGTRTAGAARRGDEAGRRSQGVPLGRGRWARSQVRRRDRDARRRGSLRDRRQPGRRALLRRGRGLGPSGTQSGEGSSRSSRGRSVT